jgi:hypothetical protein
MQLTASIDYRKLGRTLIIAGVCVWIPYFALKMTGAHPDIMLFLPVHLSGVIPGAIMARWPQIKGLIGR